MHAQMSDSQRRALAVLIHEIRDDWQVPGVAAVISSVRDRDPLETCIAFLRGTARTDQRTPAFLARDGAHWHSRAQVNADHRFERCSVVGHGSFPAWNCSACRSEQIQVDKVLPEPDPETADVASRGADRVRRALAEARKEEA